MDEELSELAKEHNLSVDDIREIRDLVYELDIDVDDAYEIWQAQ